MKTVTGTIFLVVVIFLLNSCAIFNGGKVLLAIKQIDQSSLSAENEIFERESGIQLVIVKRGLWSMQDNSKNKSIELYFLSLLNNDLVYSVNNNQNEFVTQIVQDNKIHIITNNQFNDFSDYEKAILLIVSTSTLALMTDTEYDQNNIKNMFFNFITSYDTEELPNIVKAQWYKNKNIILTSDGILVGK